MADVTRRSGRLRLRGAWSLGLWRMSGSSMRVAGFVMNGGKGASQKSCSVLRKLGPDIQWVHSYVTENKIYCVYRAPSAEMIRAHAQQAGFPADSVSQVRAQIDPTTAE